MIQAIIFDWVGTLYQRDKGLFSFSEKILQQLKPKYKLGLVTLAKNGIEERKKELISSGITHYFDSIIIDTEKTQQQYLECIKQMNSSPDKTLIVDDRTIRGIKIGNQIKCETAWIQKGEYSHQKPDQETGQPTYVIDSVENLLNILE